MHSTIPAGLSLLLALLAPPDEVRTRDGRVLVGEVTHQGEMLVVETREGVVEVPKDEVAAVRTAAELRSELKRLAADRPGDAFSHFELARTALGFGLTAEMWRHLDAALGQVGEAAALRQRLQAFLATLEPEVLPARYREADTQKRVLALVQRARDSAGPAVQAAILELLAAEQGADEALQLAAKTEPLPEQRLMALRALQRRQAQDTAALLSSRAIWDEDAALRERAVEMIRAAGDAQAAVRRLVHGLMHDVPGVRMRTARAMAGLGGDEAAALLVVAGPFAGTPVRALAGGPGVRSHMFEIENVSYIRDFDVEIAQAAAVANPVIGNARRGVVLDVNVPAVVTQRIEIEGAYRRALQKLVGSDPGLDPKTWAGWLRSQDPDAAKLLPH